MKSINQKIFHILNGDSLKEQFPKVIEGELIVARECLIDGNVNGNSLEEFFSNRAKFISEYFQEATIEEYYDKAVPEIKKITQIPDEAVINLWFEDDLFCQTNLWFVINLLQKNNKNYDIYLVRPIVNNQYGFGGLSKSELKVIYKKKLQLTDIDILSTLWEFYQQNKVGKLLEAAEDLEKKYPFIKPAVQAHIERIPTKENPGRPTNSLIKIMNELNSEDFVEVFKEFCKRESIYGFGDSQVKRMFDEIIIKRNK